MFDDQDEDLGPVLTLVIGIAIAVCLFTIGVALSLTGAFSGGVRSRGDAVSPSHATTGRATGVAPASTSVGGAIATSGPAKLYFALGSAALPVDAAPTLESVATAARRDASQRVDVSGFHDPSGDPTNNAELAKARAIAVRDALVRLGVPENRVALQKPVQVEGGGDPQEARRVEVSIH